MKQYGLTEEVCKRSHCEAVHEEAWLDARPGTDDMGTSAKPPKAMYAGRQGGARFPAKEL